MVIVLYKGQRETVRKEDKDEDSVDWC
jgi:hypothetical protein